MTKEQWYIIRTMEEIPIFAWHEYYIENGGVLKDIGIFEHIFAQILSQEWKLHSVKNGELKRKTLSFNTAVNRLLKYYQDKFPDE